MQKESAATEHGPALGRRWDLRALCLAGCWGEGAPSTPYSFQRGSRSSVAEAEPGQTGDELLAWGQLVTGTSFLFLHKFWRQWLLLRVI